MAVPKRKKSKSKTRMRKSINTRMKAGTLVMCANKDCGEMIMPHHVCPHCGHYKGRQVIEVGKEK